MEPGRSTGGSLTLVDAPPDAAKQLAEMPRVGAFEDDGNAVDCVPVPVPHEWLAGRRVQKEPSLVTDPVRVRLVATEQVPYRRPRATFEHHHLLGLVVATDAHHADCSTRFTADLIRQRLGVGVSVLNH